ncbi:MAG: Hsp20/alpha crystallin family protein [Cyclobacteriaceae bacterium]|nr:Hsp20/alpha crystallin family protein [Cyclobacteriaceae bacterium]
MALIKYSGNRFGSELDQLINQFMGDTVTSESQEVNSIRPRVDIFETEKNYLLFLEIPGVKKEDIDLKIDQNVLYIKAERRKAQLQEPNKGHRVESHYGTYERSFTLSDDLRSDSIEAKYEDGILKLEITKKAEKPFKKTIKVS